MAAARSGAGAVTLLSPPDALAVNAAHLTSIMVRETRSQQDAAQFITDRKVTAAVLGPGYGNPAFARDYTKMLLSAASGKAGQFRGLVLDADGITAFENKPDELFDTHRSSATALVLTPHEGEFKRLFPILPKTILQKSTRPARRPCARMRSCHLQGAGYGYRGAGWPRCHKPNGTPFLATAGSWRCADGHCLRIAGTGHGALCCRLCIRLRARGCGAPFWSRTDCRRFACAIVRGLVVALTFWLEHAQIWEPLSFNGPICGSAQRRRRSMTSPEIETSVLPTRRCFPLPREA